MSDEFLRVAKKELTEDISSIGILLQSCTDDVTLSKNALRLERHIHKIKGLAPMMGSDKIGYVAALVDDLLKTVIDGNSLKGIYLATIKSYEFMQNTINGANPDLDHLKVEIENATKST
jgi:hypothetical protein